jgi:hypothetical protein
MILASFVGIFAIPPLYVTFQAIREKMRPSARPEKVPKKVASDWAGAEPAEIAAAPPTHNATE